MRRATTTCPAGTWPEAEAVATVTLDFEDRYRRRIRLTDDDGRPFLLDLEEATRLAEGDALAVVEGGFIRVCAAAEPVDDVRCRNLSDTARMAWHIGNRHVPVQVLDDGALRIRHDHVIADMARQLGAEVEHKNAPFTPEPGAYAPANGHDHSHGHDHDH
ncbi:MAG: urease accessory protein UreE [Alphaproteobacteria bacterium]|nr:urease accessory protein UreE [Alphaproteobacteria bacterium]